MAPAPLPHLASPLSRTPWTAGRPPARVRRRSWPPRRPRSPRTQHRGRQRPRGGDGAPRRAPLPHDATAPLPSAVRATERHGRRGGPPPTGRRPATAPAPARWGCGAARDGGGGDGREATCGRQQHRGGDDKAGGGRGAPAPPCRLRRPLGGAAGRGRGHRRAVQLPSRGSETVTWLDCWTGSRLLWIQYPMTGPSNAIKKIGHQPARLSISTMSLCGFRIYNVIRFRHAVTLPPSVAAPVAGDSFCFRRC